MLQRFSEENGPQYYKLNGVIMKCKHKGMSIVTYYAKFKKL